MSFASKIPVYGACTVVQWLHCLTRFAVECCLKSCSTARPSDVREQLEAAIQGRMSSLEIGPLDVSEDSFLGLNVKCCDVTEIGKHTFVSLL